LDSRPEIAYSYSVQIMHSGPGPPAGGTLKSPKGQILVGSEENNQMISILTFFAAYGSWNSAKMVLSVLFGPITFTSGTASPPHKAN